MVWHGGLPPVPHGCGWVWEQRSGILTWEVKAVFSVFWLATRSPEYLEMWSYLFSSFWESCTWGSSQPHPGFTNGQESTNAPTCWNRTICFLRVLFSLDFLVAFHGRGYRSRVVGKALNFFKSYTKCCTPKRSIVSFRYSPRKVASGKPVMSSRSIQRCALTSWAMLWHSVINFIWRPRNNPISSCSLWKPVPKRSWMRCLQRM